MNNLSESCATFCSRTKPRPASQPAYLRPTCMVFYFTPVCGAKSMHCDRNHDDGRARLLHKWAQHGGGILIIRTVTRGVNSCTEVVNGKKSRAGLESRRCWGKIKHRKHRHSSSLRLCLCRESKAIAVSCRERTLWMEGKNQNNTLQTSWVSRSRLCGRSLGTSSPRWA